MATHGRSNSGQGQVVVVVADDEPLVRDIVRIVLESMGMFVLTASDGEEALRIAQLYSGPIHALVSDIVMPHLDGVALCEQMLCRRPNLKVLLMSAFTYGAPDGLPFLRKPFSVEELRERVRQLVAQPLSAPSATAQR